MLKNTQVTLLGPLSNYWALCSFLFSPKHLQGAHHTLPLLLILVMEPSQFLPSQQWTTQKWELSGVSRLKNPSTDSETVIFPVCREEEKGERRMVVFHTAGISGNKQGEHCQHMLLGHCRNSTSSHSPSLLPGKDPPGFGLCNLLVSCGSSQHRMQAQSQDPNLFSWYRLLLATIHCWH